MHHTILDKIDDINTYKNMGINHYRLELFDEDQYQVKELINRFIAINKNK